MFRQYTFKFVLRTTVRYKLMPWSRWKFGYAMRSFRKSITSTNLEDAKSFFINLTHEFIYNCGWDDIHSWDVYSYAGKTLFPYKIEFTEEPNIIGDEPELVSDAGLLDTTVVDSLKAMSLRQFIMMLNSELITEGDSDDHETQAPPES